MVSRLFYHQSKAEIEPVIDLDDLIPNVIGFNTDVKVITGTQEIGLVIYDDLWLEDLVYSSELG